MLKTGGRSFIQAAACSKQAAACFCQKQAAKHASLVVFCLKKLFKYYLNIKQTSGCLF